MGKIAYGSDELMGNQSWGLSKWAAVANPYIHDNARYQHDKYFAAKRVCGASYRRYGIFPYLVGQRSFHANREHAQALYLPARRFIQRRVGTTTLYTS